MHRSLVSLGLCVALAAVGCGPNGGNGQSNGGDSDAPLNLAETELGVTFHHGEAGSMKVDGGDRAQRAIRETGETFGTAFVDVQLYDEHSWIFGKWTVQPQPMPNPKKYSDQNPDLARFKTRSGDLVDEVEGAFGAFGKDGFDKLGVILDPWRMRGDWYVRWDGKLKDKSNRIGEGDYGFFRSDMTQNMLAQIKTVAQKHNPQYFIVGTEMERLLGREGKAGIAPDDFSNFRQFYRKAVERIDKQSPNSKVGVGFNWDRFAKFVAPGFGEGKVGEVPPRETLERAFRAVIYPVARRGRLLALESYRPASGDASSYQFLADLDEMFEMEGISVVWYSIGSPVQDSVSYRKQRTYLKNFIDWNKGIEPDLVVWRSLLNIQGADAGDQQVEGRCKKLIDKKRFKLDKVHCFDGLYKAASFEKKEVYQFLQEEMKGGGETGMGENGGM